MKTRYNPFLAIAFTFALTTKLPAAVLTWDITPSDSAVTGGTGDWNTTTANWTNDSGASNVNWPASSSGDDDAAFGGTGGTVTIAAGGVTANDISFTTAGYTISGGTLTLDGSSATPVISGNVNATISSGLSGTAGLAKSGQGTLTLSGDNTGLSGVMTLQLASGVANAGIILSGANAPGGITQIDVNGSTSGPADGSFLGLANTTLAAGVTINLTGQGGNSTPGTLRATSGSSVVNGPVNIGSTNVRISSFGGTSLTLNGAVTSSPASNGCYIRFGQNQGVIFTNPLNSWEGTTQLGEGSVYFHPGALPSNTLLFIGGSNPADFGTNGSFTRSIGTSAGQVQFGRANDGQRAIGFSARGGPLTVNLGGAAADLAFINAFGKTGATSNGSPTVTVTDASNLVVGMSVTGTGIPADTLVSTISGTTVTLNKNATATNAAVALSFFAAADSSGFNSSVLVLNGANADSPITLANPLDLNGFGRTIQVSANTATLAGGIKNSSATAGGLRKTGAGTLPYDPGSSDAMTLTGINAGGGVLELKSGTYTVTGSGATGQPDSIAGFIVARGGTFRLSGATVNVTGGGSLLTAGNTSGGGNNFILDSGTFDGGGKEVLHAYGGTGTFTMNGGLFVGGEFRISQSAAGVVNLNGGILRVRNLKHNNNAETVNFNGGTLQAKENRTDFITAAVDVLNIQSGGAVIDSNGFNVAIPRALDQDAGSPGGGLTKRGNGILDLTAAANNHTGTNLIQGGVLRIADNAQLGSTSAPIAPVTVDGGEFGVSGTAISSITSLGRTFNYITGGFHVADASHTLNVDIDLTGSGGLSKSGAGTILLTGANDFTGNLACGAGAAGWIEVDSATDLGIGPKTGNFTASSQSGTGGIRLLGGIIATEVDLSISGRNVDPETQQVLWNVSGDNKWPGDILIANTGGTYYLRSDADTLELSGTLGNTLAASVTPDTRIFNLQGPGDYLISGTIVDGANANRLVGLAANGSGTVALSGTNTYTGTTTVADGVLLVNGDNSAATGAIAVDGDAVLGGTGSLGGAVTVSTDAKLAPGTSAGTLTTSANVGGAGTLDVEIDGAAADKLVLTGTGTIDISTLKLNVATLAGGATQPVYVIVDSAAAISGAAFASVTGVPSGYTLTYNYNDGVDSNNIALVSGTGSPFTTWATTTNGLTGGDAAAGADPDNDGLDNAIEFVIGGQPNPANPGAASNSLAPTIDASGSNLVFTFRRTDLALTQPGIAINVEYGSNLTGWTTAQDGVNGISVVPTNDFYGAGVDRVVVTIPKALAAGSSMFARLNVAIP